MFWIILGSIPIICVLIAFTVAIHADGVLEALEDLDNEDNE